MVFDQDAYEAFQRAEHCPVQQHRCVFLAVFANVACTEPARQVEVHLVGATLPVAADSVAQNKLEFRPVESAFARVVFIVETGGFQRRFQRCFCLVPDRVFADADFRPVGKLDEYIVETEIA